MELTAALAAVRRTTLVAAETTMRTRGVVPRPAVHLFVDDPDQPYVGCVVSRDFDRGEDAAWAIRGLGHAPAALPAAHVLLIWEDGELELALGFTRPARGQALMVLEATVDDHTVTRYPFIASPGEESSVDLRWGEPRTLRRPALPQPVADLLDIWREGSLDDFAATVDELVEGGYRYTAAATGAAPSFDAVHHAVGAALTTGEPAAVEHACRIVGQVLDTMSWDDPRRGLYLVDLSLVRQLRFENGGDLADVVEAVRAAREAASHPDGEPPAKRLNALGTALRTLYEQTGDPTALHEAVTACRQAVTAIAAHETNFATCLVNLALALHKSFMAGGDDAVLDEALSTTRRALDVLGREDPRHETVATNLATLLSSHYGRTGDLAVLTEAIAVGRSAVTATASTGWMLAARLSNLALALVSRYRRTGDLDSLREAIRATRRALVVAPPEHADRTIYQLGLADALRTLFHRTGDPAILDEAFAAARDAVRRIPAGHPYRPNHLANLAGLHQLSYADTAAVADLDAAEVLLRTALADTTPAHPQRPTLLSSLGETLAARGGHTGDAGPLAEAADAVREALDAVADDHPARGMMLQTLADVYETRHRIAGDEDALPMAIEQLSAAAAHPSSSMRSRVTAARRWGAVAVSAGRTEEALEGFATAVELLPQLAARSLHRYDSEYWLGQFGGLASDAAALALTANTPERALILLELGRAVLMAQAMDARTDLSDLRERAPTLAERFEWLSTRLETGDGDQQENRQALATELDAVIATVRELPGMDRFLLPPAVADLVAQAGHGPIVVVNVSRYRCDALLLTGDGLRVRPLPLLTPEALGDQVRSFHTALHADCRSVYRSARQRGEQVVASTLTWLWDTVAAPVLDTLGPAPGRRIWWIPTGPLGFLPLHAATGGAAGESALDRVVSSYTSSVRALSHARGAGPRPPGGTLVVGMPHTPGDATDLPGAREEARFVASRAPDPRTLIGPDATRAAVAAALRHSAWAHFACHATTAPSPSDSHLLLHDHEQQPLNVTAISRERLPSAALAYLSACDTAVPATDLADEVIHIASAFHLAGFPRVIGTLWTIDDAAAAAIAELVYGDLTAGVPDPDRAAGALHDATVVMRDKHRDRPSLWAGHIHFGV